MVEKFKGCVVSIDCGPVLGVFTGTISHVDTACQTISLVTPTRNHSPCKVPQITISSCDIKEIKILKPASNQEKQAPLPHFSGSAFQPPNNAISGGTNKQQEGEPKKKGDFIKRRPSLSKKNTTDGAGNKKWQNQKDEACFNISINNSILGKDFDFEKNLALFDKQAVFDQIDAATKQDGVPIRLVDTNKRSVPKYRHDENVLETVTPDIEQIILPCGTEKHFVTDSGLLVPTITLEMRDNLIKMATECGLSVKRLLDMFGRSASEMILQLLGGCHRLHPQNAHQQPVVVILAGPHHQGTQAVDCGRHLSNHGVDVTLILSPPTAPYGIHLQQELNLYRLSGGKEASSVTELPSDVDLVVGALDGHNPVTPIDRSLVRWAQASKAPTLVLDPPPMFRLSLDPKWILVPILPFTFAEDCTIYLCDLGIPQEVFIRLGIKYKSPFGSKFLIPLHKIT